MYLNVIFTFWSDNNKEADLVGFTKHYDARIVVKVLLCINCIVELGSIITATQHKLTVRQLQLAQSSTQHLCSIYRVVQKKTVPQFYFCDNFRKWTPILTIFSPLEQEIHAA